MRCLSRACVQVELSFDLNIVPLWSFSVLISPDANTRSVPVHVCLGSEFTSGKNTGRWGALAYTYTAVYLNPVPEPLTRNVLYILSPSGAGLCIHSNICTHMHVYPSVYCVRGGEESALMRAERTGMCCWWSQCYCSSANQGLTWDCIFCEFIQHFKQNTFCDLEAPFSDLFQTIGLDCVFGLTQHNLCPKSKLLSHCF